jgi:hypothetical protein
MVPARGVRPDHLVAGGRRTTSMIQAQSSAS